MYNYLYFLKCSTGHIVIIVESTKCNYRKETLKKGVGGEVKT